VRPEAAFGDPDDVGVERDLDGGVAGAVVWLAGADGEHAGQGLLPGAGGELAQPPLARDPGAGATVIRLPLLPGRAPRWLM